jgi:hypothetical protein
MTISEYNANPGISASAIKAGGVGDWNGDTTAGRGAR